MATPIKQIQVGGTNYNIRGYFYGTCANAIDEPNKVVVCPEFSADDLVDGNLLVINFEDVLDTDEAGPIYLNVNGTGNKLLMWFVDHDLSASGYFSHAIPALCIYSTNIDCWILIGPSQDLNTTYTSPTNDSIKGWTVNRYAACSTAAGTAAKTADVTNGTVTLSAGLAVYVKFTNANTADNPTLNISSKGAKNIFYNGAQITTGDEKSLLKGTCLFVYDGTQWHLIPSGGSSSTSEESIFYGTGQLDVDTMIITADCSGFTANDLVEGTIVNLSVVINHPDESEGYATYLNINNTGNVSVYDETGLNRVWMSPDSHYIYSFLYSGYEWVQIIPSGSNGTTYTAGTGLSLSGTTINHSNSVTAKTTQAVYPIKFDAQGHITGSGNAVTISDTKVTQTNSSGNANYRVLLSGNANGTTETTTSNKSDHLLFNPYTSKLYITGTGETFVSAQNSTVGPIVYLDSAGNTSGNGVYSSGYYNGSENVNQGKWLIYRAYPTGKVYVDGVHVAGHTHSLTTSSTNTGSKALSPTTTVSGTTSTSGTFTILTITASTTVPDHNHTYVQATAVGTPQ